MDRKNPHNPVSRPNRIPWPPILYGTAIAAGFVLGRLLPLPWPGGMAGEWLFMTGLLLIACALFIDVRTFLELRKHKTTIMPNKAADHLVTSGPFSFSRNPIYVSNTMLTIGLGFAFANAWLFICGLTAAFGTHHLAILREERHLAAKFGTAWHHYTKKARRWI
jgi:protein-S-isoprenylcysteine O-methyltransferase Ste14